MYILSLVNMDMDNPDITTLFTLQKLKVKELDMIFHIILIIYYYYWGRVLTTPHFLDLYRLIILFNNVDRIGPVGDGVLKKIYTLLTPKGENDEDQSNEKYIRTVGKRHDVEH